MSFDKPKDKAAPSRRGFLQGLGASVAIAGVLGVEELVRRSSKTELPTPKPEDLTGKPDLLYRFKEG